MCSFIPHRLFRLSPPSSSVFTFLLDEKMYVRPFIPFRPRFSPSLSFLNLFNPPFIIIVSYPPSARAGSGGIALPGAAAVRVHYVQLLRAPFMAQRAPCMAVAPRVADAVFAPRPACACYIFYLAVAQRWAN